jgi:P27 family predicted phage terminase small subunit
MSRPGQQPIPTALKIVAGNPGDHALPKNGPKPKISTLTAPRHLHGVAKKEWKRLAKVLRDDGLLTTVDRDAFALYCETYAIYAAAVREIDRTGAFIDGKPAPALKVIDVQFIKMRQLLTEFGMTPASRTRVTVVPEAERQPPRAYEGM